MNSAYKLILISIPTHGEKGLINIYIMANELWRQKIVTEFDFDSALSFWRVKSSWCRC